MGSRYTAKILEGVSFFDYVLECARECEFDDNLPEGPIPDEIKPDSYYEVNVRNAILALHKLEKMTDEDKKIACRNENRRNQRHWLKVNAKKKKTKNTYLKMLEQVNGWKPPTDAHEYLKIFMAEQIKLSIQYDCNEHPKEINVTWREWYKLALENAQDDIEYFSQRQVEEVERAMGKTIWIQQLKQSLNEQKI